MMQLLIHTFKTDKILIVDVLNLTYTTDNFSVLNNTLVISIDEAEIFTLHRLNLTRIPYQDEIKEERLENEHFLLPWNKTWGLTIDVFKAIFPYEHSYSDAVQNEFISIFKWLKVVHNKKKVLFTADSPLPSDLLINVGLLAVRKSAQVLLLFCRLKNFYLK